MDEDYLLTWARYVGLNPARAGLTARAIVWPWSSVGAHVDGRADPLSMPAPLSGRLGDGLARFFDVDVEAEAPRKLRHAAVTGRPMGAAAWVKTLEQATGRQMGAPPRGRPPRAQSIDSAAQG